MSNLLDNIPGLLSAAGPRPMDIIFSLLLAFVVAGIISQLYKYTHRGLSFELSFMSTLVLLAPIVTVVMLFIRGDLVLSLGLIGSLSIIRFRTPIKDTRDMVFLFWVIAVGLGCGTYNWLVVVISSIMISLVLILLHLIRYGQSHNIDYVLVVSGHAYSKSEDLSRVIRKNTKEVQIRSKETEDDFWETIFEIRFDRMNHDSVDKLLREIRNIEGVNKVSLLAPQIALPV